MLFTFSKKPAMRISGTFITAAADGFTPSHETIVCAHRRLPASHNSAFFDIVATTIDLKADVAISVSSAL